MNTNKHELLYKELSFKIQGAAIEVRKNFGSGLKENLYQNAFIEELESRGIKFEREKAIKIYSPKTGKYIGLYRPDFIIEDKIIVETKAVTKIPKMFLDQIYGYLRNSKYELGYFINFASPKLYIKRIIFTNDRKQFFSKILVVISLIFVSFSVCFRAQAVILFSEAANQDIYEGQTFVVDWFLDTEGKIINTLDLRLDFSKDTLQAIDVSSGNSLLNLWVNPPHMDNEAGKLGLIGGIPNGANGQKIPIFRSVFLAESKGEGFIKLNPDSLVLLNDGAGSGEALKFKNEIFNIYPEDFIPVRIFSATNPDPNQWSKNHNVGIQFEPKAGEDYSYSFSSNIDIIPDDQKDDVSGGDLQFQNQPDGIYYFKLHSKTGHSQWKEAAVFRVQIDSTPPEAFQPVVGTDPAAFSGSPFLSFSTVDKTSGISHYNVKVGLFGLTKETQSPLQLNKPWIGDQVRVFAYDQAGNVTEVQIDWPGYASSRTFQYFLVLVGLLAAVYYIQKSFKKSK